jgi:hypothetical protein
MKWRAIPRADGDQHAERAADIGEAAAKKKIKSG